MTEVRRRIPEDMLRDRRMLYARFEDLPVWNDAVDLATRIYALSRQGVFGGYAGLRDQIERAALSISNNIAEGFERGTHQELITFLYIARGSSGEVRSMLRVVQRLPDLEARDREFHALIAALESINRQLGRWIESLKNSESRGARYNNDKTRRAAEGAKRREAFLEKLKQIQDGTSPEFPSTFDRPQSLPPAPPPASDSSPS